MVIGLHLSEAGFPGDTARIPPHHSAFYGQASFVGPAGVIIEPGSRNYLPKGYDFCLSPLC